MNRTRRTTLHVCALPALLAEQALVANVISAPTESSPMLQVLVANGANLAKQDVAACVHNAMMEQQKTWDTFHV